MTQLFESFTGKLSSGQERTHALQKIHGVILHAFGIIALAAGWGLAAASGAPALAVANLYKVPMVITLSALIALPPMFVARHLVDLRTAPFDLVSVLVGSLFRGVLMLIAFAPLLAVYTYTSQWFAPFLAQVSGLVAVLVTGFSLRSRMLKLEGRPSRLELMSAVSIVTLALALLQLISLATPILPVSTVFGAGIDGLLK